MIVEPFNGVFLILLAIMLMFIVGASSILKDKSKKAKKTFIVTVAVLDIICFVFYKLALSRDSEFLTLTNLAKFNWLDELPLQLCNINMFLIPIGVLAENTAMMGFSYIVAPLGAMMALVCPDPSFVGFSIFVPRMLGYYITHMVVFCLGIFLATLGFYKPKLSDMPGVLLTLLCVSAGAHCFNLLLRYTGLCGHANYFYTFGADISLLNLFWSWIPLPYLYELPAFLILLAYMGLQILFFKLLEKFKKPEAEKELSAIS